MDTLDHHDETFRSFVQAKIVADREAKVTLDEGFAAYQAFVNGRGGALLCREAFVTALREVAFSAKGVQVEDRFLGLRLA